MQWLVIKFRGGGIQVMSRIEREIHIGAMIDIGMPVYSIVLKTFDDEDSAYKYMDDLHSADKLLDQILPEQ
jgi:hypothetical protein